MNNMFGDAVALSDSNKGMIEAFFPVTPTGVTIGRVYYPFQSTTLISKLP